MVPSGLEVPVQIEAVGSATLGIERGFRDGGGCIVRADRPFDAGFTEVLVDHLAVFVPAITANKPSGMPQAGEAHGDVEGATTRVGPRCRPFTVHDVYEGFAHDGQHDFSLSILGSEETDGLEKLLATRPMSTPTWRDVSSATLFSGSDSHNSQRDHRDILYAGRCSVRKEASNGHARVSEASGEKVKVEPWPIPSPLPNGPVAKNWPKP